MRAATAVAASVVLLLAACSTPSADPEPGSTDPSTTSSPNPESLGPFDIPVEIVVMGDFGSGSGDQRELAGTMRDFIEKRDVALLVTTGDNFYSDEVEEIWHEPYGWLAEEGVEVAAAWGNHDIETPSRLELVRRTLGPPGRWYSVPLGDGKLIVLDSNQVDDPEQLDWLRSELETSGSPIIISFHHPAFSCGVYANDDDIRQTWVPVIQPFDVTLVLNGHEHHYERFDVAGTTYVVTGGGGMKIRDRKECSDGVPEPIVGNYEDHHFVLLGVDDGRIRGEVIDRKGNVIDTFSVSY